MADLLAIARRHLAAGRGDERDEGHEQSPRKGPPADLSSSPSSLSYPSPAAVGWGCHRAEVQRLLAEADALVEAAGVPGTHPLVDAAAGTLASATLTGDIETMRFAAAEFRVAVMTAARPPVTLYHCPGG